MTERPPLPPQKSVELLAPAGSFDALVAAVENGADAVYLGGQGFNARKFAANFTDGQLQAAIDLAHVRGVRVFVTLNTLVFNHEMAEALAFLSRVREMGADAVIVQDMGIMRAMRELAPDLPLHISTQATVHNSDGIRFLEDLGAERVILARENSLKEMSEMKQQTGAELEQFVHGAMCYCYSGQCLMSSLIGGRSGNRGACAYTCRLPYTMEEGRGQGAVPTAVGTRLGGDEPAPAFGQGQGQGDERTSNVTFLPDDDNVIDGMHAPARDVETPHPSLGVAMPQNPTPGFVEGDLAFDDLPDARGKRLISARDMNTLRSVDRLIASGVVSFKIEGRMKRPEYVAIVTRAYRNAIDRTFAGNFHVTKEEEEAVRRVFNREFNNSWLDGKEKWAFTNWDSAGNQGVPIGTVRKSGNGWVLVQLMDRLRVNDGIEIIHQPDHWRQGDPGAPEEYGFTVTQMLKEGRYLTEAEPGEVVELRGHQFASPGDQVFKTADIEVLDAARASYEKGPHRRVAVDVHVTVRVGEPLRVRLRDRARGFTAEHVSSFIVQQARSAPLARDRVREQMEKFGGSVLEPASLAIELEGRVFVPLGELNEARRKACEALETTIARAYRRAPVADWDTRAQALTELPAMEREPTRALTLAVNCWGLPNVRAALEAGAKTIYFSGLRVGGLQPRWDEEGVEAAARLAKEHGAELWIATGMVQKDHEVAMLRTMVRALKGKVAGVLAGHHGALQVAIEEGVPAMGDWMLNLNNSISVDYLEQHLGMKGTARLERVTLSPELTMKDVDGIARHTRMPIEVLAHGRLTLMTSEYCSIGHATRCQLPGGTWAPCHDKKYKLRDRIGKHFPLETDGACRMYILNSVELNMVDRLDQLRAAGVDVVRIETIGTTPEATAEQVRAYLGAIENINAGKPFDKEHWRTLEATCTDGFTTGHFYRGPE